MSGTDTAGWSRLVAKDAIRDVVYRYCRGIDRLDLDLVRSCYHSDGTDSHGSFEGGVDAYLAWVEPLLSRYDRTFHFIGNLLIDFDNPTRGRVSPRLASAVADPTVPTVACCESYGIAHHESAGGPTHANLVTGFRFIDRFEDRGKGWAIASRTAVTEWSRKDDESGWWSPPEDFERGSRNGADPLYRTD